MKVPPPRRRWWSMKRWWAVSLAGALALFAAWQFAAYHLEGGITVADRPGETPLSQRFPVSFKPLAERAHMAERLGTYKAMEGWFTRQGFATETYAPRDGAEAMLKKDCPTYRVLGGRGKSQAKLSPFSWFSTFGLAEGRPVLRPYAFHIDIEYCWDMRIHRVRTSYSTL